MQTLTDLANAALAYLGDMAISSITDEDSKPARLCNQFAQPSIDETLRLHRWNRATRRHTLVRDATAPPFGYTYRYQLPHGWLRILEVNGETWDDSTEYFAIEGNYLLTNEDSVEITIIQRIDIGACDPLCQDAIALRLAAKIAAPLTGAQENRAVMEALAEKSLSKARHIDSLENGTREVPQWERVLGRSRLLRARGSVRNPLRIEDF